LDFHLDGSSGQFFHGISNNDYYNDDKNNNDNHHNDNHNNDDNDYNGDNNDKNHNKSISGVNVKKLFIFVTDEEAK